MIYDIFPFKDFNPSLIPRLRENFKRIQHAFNHLQSRYFQKEPVWDAKPTKEEVQEQIDLSALEQEIEEAMRLVESINTIEVEAPLPVADQILQDELMVGEEVKDRAIQAWHIAQQAIRGEHIAPSSIGDVHLIAGQITEAKMRWNTHLLY